ncbi:MAG TPA: T9SS type A sorting domain-containing protein, partial [Chitinophagaceae bacterium]|nr:T9SS type A sorting domain-containing protein [Chitinophagaceae bacterium]
YKGGVDLSTADNNMFGYLSPDSANQWKTNKIDLSAFANLPNVLICFENISGKDNLIYIDNVKVQQAAAVVTDVAAESAIVKKSACNNILIAPNPVNNTFRISGFNAAEKISVQCFNSVGQLVWQTASTDSEWLHLPSQLNAGMYFLHIATEHTSCVKKMEVKR